MARCMIACGLALLASNAMAADNLVGGWGASKADAEKTKMLTEALKKDDNYDASVKARVCFKNITAVEEQVVAGMNYKFTVNGCEVKAASNSGMCAENEKCDPKDFDIVIWQQLPGDGGKAKVTLIGPKGSAPSGGSKHGSGSGFVTAANPNAGDSAAGSKPSNTAPSSAAGSRLTAPSTASSTASSSAADKNTAASSQGSTMKPPAPTPKKSSAPEQITVTITSALVGAAVAFYLQL